MNLVFRLLILLISSRMRPRQELMSPAFLGFRVLPTDLDVNLHLTNSRYLAFMDLGRIELMLRSGLFGAVIRRRWLPVVSTASLRFRREIGVFQRINLNTRLLGWDEKWFYMEQRFETGQGLAAIGIVKGLFRGPDGNVPTQQLLSLAGYSGDMNRTGLMDALDAYEKALQKST
ncbi:MAG: thioesterase family protein [Sedimenticola sp.]|nr:thioesterase family protein [Sedimenticola sp.]